MKIQTYCCLTTSKESYADHSWAMGQRLLLWYRLSSSQPSEKYLLHCESSSSPRGSKGQRERRYQYKLQVRDSCKGARED